MSKSLATSPMHRSRSAADLRCGGPLSCDTGEGLLSFEKTTDNTRDSRIAARNRRLRGYARKQSVPTIKSDWCSPHPFERQLMGGFFSYSSTSTSSEEWEEHYHASERSNTTETSHSPCGSSGTNDEIRVNLDAEEVPWGGIDAESIDSMLDADDEIDLNTPRTDRHIAKIIRGGEPEEVKRLVPSIRSPAYHRLSRSIRRRQIIASLRVTFMLVSIVVMFFAICALTITGVMWVVLYD